MKNLILALSILLTLFVAGCQEKVVTIDTPSQTLSGTVAIAFDNAPSGIVRVVATLTREGYAAKVITLSVDSGNRGASGSFQEVPGGRWHLRVDAFADTGSARYTGETDVDVIAGNVSSVTLELHAATGGIDIHVSWGNLCLQAPAGLIHWWPGDGNPADLAGNTPGWLANGGAYGEGKVGQGFELDGVDDYLELTLTPYMPPHNVLRLPGSFTLEAWIYPTTDTLGAVFSQWGGYNEWTNQRCVGFGMIAGRNLRFGVTDSAHQNDESFHSFDTYVGVLTLRSWNHVAAVYDQDSGKRQIFVNGRQVAQRFDPPFKLFQSVAAFTIGAQEYAPGILGANFPGKIDEVSLYNRPLRPAEIRSVYLAGNAGKCKP